MLDVILTIHSVDGTKQVPVTKERLTMGRGGNADLRIDDPGLSRLHASINRKDHRVWILDEGSTNGSYVNGKPVPAVGKRLSDNDKVNVGDYTTIWVSIVSPDLNHVVSDEPNALPQPAPSQSFWPFVAAFAVVVIFFGSAAWYLTQNSARGNDEDRTSAVRISNENTNPSPPRSSIDVRSLANQLAFKVVGKDWYVFDEEFVNEIKQHTGDYRGVIIDEPCCAEISVAFSNKQGLSPLLGLVMALSQRKVKGDATAPQAAGDSNTGVWLLRVPPAIAIEQGWVKAGEESALEDPRHSADIAAEYMKQLVGYFAKEDFMYAVACYGMRFKQVGELRTQLARIDPEARKDFWNVIRSDALHLGADRSVAADRVARFFAAGIVGDNPQPFENSSRPLSSMY